MDVTQADTFSGLGLVFDDSGIALPDPLDKMEDGLLAPPRDPKYRCKRVIYALDN